MGEYLEFLGRMGRNMTGWDGARDFACGETPPSGKQRKNNPCLYYCSYNCVRRRYWAPWLSYQFTNRHKKTQPHRHLFLSRKTAAKHIITMLGFLHSVSPPVSQVIPSISMHPARSMPTGQCIRSAGQATIATSSAGGIFEGTSDSPSRSKNRYLGQVCTLGSCVLTRESYPEEKMG
ncbi:hypothetical protein LX32DRAFT_213848 [Colletotrichum zoysiae]|uniref:Uncharacterized protein n=1 Tax=Colletotrichum zoysiae TaxID=1216348 RepID=A0AAD9LXN6_9PEZI|nr:hypothetical protein LX32DRAFT_213848 [Colletotrichum zoysiae]